MVFCESGMIDIIELADSIIQTLKQNLKAIVWSNSNKMNKVFTVVYHSKMLRFKYKSMLK